MSHAEYAEFSDTKLAEFVDHFAADYEAAASDRSDRAPFRRYVALTTLHGIALELNVRHTPPSVGVMVDAMRAVYDPATARFAKGTAVYLGSQVWTVGMEHDGLAQITRGGKTRFVGSDDLTLVTAEDEHRAAAFAHLGRLS
jgi:hypothetical protein